MTAKRREARAFAMNIVYSMECTGYGVTEALAIAADMPPGPDALPPFTRQLCETYYNNREVVEADLCEVLENWKLDRVAPIERALLKLGCSEISYFPDIPPRVTINEYIELAKRYADDNAPGFINGVLDKLVQRKEKRDFKVDKPQNL